MKNIRDATKIIVMLLLLSPLIGAAPELDAILQQARSWKPGQPIPFVLASYRHDGDCFLVETDTEAVIPELHNLPLLTALVVDSQVDPRVSDEALNAALAEFGPSQVFSLIQKQFSEGNSSVSTKRTKTLIDRMQMRHVVVDGIFISKKKMRAEEAWEVISSIETELLTGKAWSDVLAEYQQRYEYSAPDWNGTLTRVGNMGRFVVFPHRLLGRTYYVNEGERNSVLKGPTPAKDFANLAWLPRDHGKVLLKARAGQIVKLENSDDDELVIYQVSEVYP